MSKCYKCGEDLIGFPGEHTPCPAKDIYGIKKNQGTQLALPIKSEEVKKEAPTAIISDGKYAIQAFQDRIEIWGIAISPGVKFLTFNSVESLVKSIWTLVD
jgi:hypothetical protein